MYLIGQGIFPQNNEVLPMQLYLYLGICTYVYCSIVVTKAGNIPKQPESQSEGESEKCCQQLQFCIILFIEPVPIGMQGSALPLNLMYFPPYERVSMSRGEKHNFFLSTILGNWIRCGGMTMKKGRSRPSLYYLCRKPRSGNFSRQLHLYPSALTLCQSKNKDPRSVLTIRLSAFIYNSSTYIHTSYPIRHFA